MKPVIITKIHHHGIFTMTIKAMMRLVKKRPKIINKNETLPNQAIFVCNHSGASGPFSLSLYFPKLFVPWGAHPMTEGYRSRWKYLYHTFYQQKLKFGKIRSFLISTLFALVSKMLYNGMHVIPTYPDIRVRHTIDFSIRHLNIGNPVLIFPEDSSDGYHDILKSYNSGFVYLSTSYFKTYGIDLPVYPIYYHQKRNVLFIEKPHYLQEYVQLGFNRNLIAQNFLYLTNAMQDELADLRMI